MEPANMDAELSEAEEDLALAIDENDPVVQRVVEKALAPWVGRVTPAYLIAMRAALTDMLLCHPTTETLIRSLRDQPIRQKSGEEPIGEASAVDFSSAKKATGSGE